MAIVISRTGLVQGRMVIHAAVWRKELRREGMGNQALAKSLGAEREGKPR